MKKLVSVLLAVLLAAGLFVPAMAEEEDPTPISPMPVITAQPQNIRFRYTFEPSTTEFSVEAYIPNGDPIGYEWHKKTIFGDTTLYGESDTYWFSPLKLWDQGQYYVVVYNKDDPTCRVTSETARLNVDLAWYFIPVTTLLLPFQLIAIPIMAFLILTGIIDISF